MKTQNLFSVLAASTIGIFTMTPSEAQAATINLNFDSLPTEQGWIRDSNGSISAFSVDGTKLTQNSIGRGSFFERFRMNNVIDPDQPFILSFTARYLSEQVVLSPVSPFSFVVYLYNFDEGFQIALGRSNYQNIVDTSVFNDYRLEGSFSTGVASLYINDIFIGNQNTVSFGESTNTIVFGDSTFTANASAGITALSFQQSEPTSIPEPSNVLGLFLVAGISIVTGIKFKKKEDPQTEEDT